MLISLGVVLTKNILEVPKSSDENIENYIKSFSSDTVLLKSNRTTEIISSSGCSCTIHMKRLSTFYEFAFRESSTFV